MLAAAGIGAGPPATAEEASDPGSGPLQESVSPVVPTVGSATPAPAAQTPGAAPAPVAEPVASGGTGWPPPGLPAPPPHPASFSLLSSPLSIGSTTVAVVGRADGYFGAWAGNASGGFQAAGLSLTPRFLLIQDASGTRFEPLDDDPTFSLARFGASLQGLWGDIGTGPKRGRGPLPGAILKGIADLAKAPPVRDWVRRAGRWLLTAVWLVGVMAGLLFPRRLTAGSQALGAFPFRSLGWGVVGLLLLAGLIAALVNSLLGIPLLLPVCGITLMILSPLGLVAGTGGLAALLGSNPRRAFPLPPAVLSGVLLALVAMAPRLGGPLAGLVILCGLGGIIRSGLAGLDSPTTTSEGGT